MVIVVDMWLKGFDCPPAHTTFLDKPLAGHNLMQAIARVNRIHGEKPGGLIVDMLSLAGQLEDALAVYTQAGGTGEAVKRVQDEAVPGLLRRPNLRLNLGLMARAALAPAAGSYVLASDADENDVKVLGPRGRTKADLGRNI